MRALRMLGLLSLLAAASVTPAHSAGFGPDASAVAAGDFDGDGKRDLIVQSGGGSSTFVVNGVRGIDGSTLWSSTIAIPGDPWASWNRAGPARLGPSGEAGVLVVCERLTVTGRALHVIALGRDGRELWRWSAQGSTIVDAGSIGDPVFFASFRANGVADDVLVGRVTKTQVPPGIERLETAVIAGEDGSEGAKTVTLTIDGSARAVLAGDLSGDGLEDFGVVSTRGIWTGAPATSMRAYRGTDGGSLWTAALPPFANISPVGDATGDGRGEIAAHGAPTYPRTPNLALLDGADGTLRWIRIADRVVATGDVDGDGRTEVVTANEAYRFAGNQVTATLQFQALTASGGTVYSTEHSASFPLSGSSACASLGPAGDADADGAPDVRYQIYSDCRYSRAAQGGLVSGATGGVLWSVPSIGWALQDSVDAAGDDLATLIPFGGATTVTVTDGADGSTVWSMPAPGYYPGSYQLASAADLDGDGRAEVLPVITGIITVMRGTDGSILWTR